LSVSQAFFRAPLSCHKIIIVVSRCPSACRQTIVAGFCGGGRTKHSRLPLLLAATHTSISRIFAGSSTAIGAAK
jgi:hypothetical protein